MTKHVFSEIAQNRHTNKGMAIYQLANASAGCNDHGVLRLAADVVDREDIVFGDDAFEIVQINTDTTEDSTAALDNDDDVNAIETVADHGLVAGDIVRVESEYLQVVTVRDADTVELSRGYAGSTIAAHTAGQDIFKKGSTAVSAGRRALPVGATLTPAAAGPEIATGLTALNRGGWTVTYGSNYFDFTRVAGDSSVAVSETLSGTNNAWEAETVRGGIAKGETLWAVGSRVPTALDVTRGVMNFVFPFAVNFVRVTVQATDDLAAVAWGGTVAVDGNTVTLTNGTDPDWSADDRVTVEVHGNG